MGRTGGGDIELEDEEAGGTAVDMEAEESCWLAVVVVKATADLGVGGDSARTVLEKLWRDGLGVEATALVTGWLKGLGLEGRRASELVDGTDIDLTLGGRSTELVEVREVEETVRPWDTLLVLVLPLLLLLLLLLLAEVDGEDAFEPFLLRPELPELREDEEPAASSRAYGGLGAGTAG